MKKAQLTNRVFMLAFMMLFLISTGLAAATLGPVKVKDRVGNGWHMLTETYVSEEGLVSGVTTLSNYNNAFGFTGGVFVVVLDSDSNLIYATPVHKWGINAAGFSKKKTRIGMWTEQLPADVFADAASIAVIQQHTPTNRVWVWIYENRALILAKAKDFFDLFVKIKTETLTEEDIWNIVYSAAELLQTTDNDYWALEHAQEICAIVKDIRYLAEDLDGWKPNNHEDIKSLTEMLISVAKKDFDWSQEAEVKKLVDSIVAMIQADGKEFVPDNIYRLRGIVEKMYELCKDEGVPENVRGIIERVLDGLNSIP